MDSLISASSLHGPPRPIFGAVLARIDVQGIRYLVTSLRHEQPFADGSVVWLHAVQHGERRSPFLRALRSHEAWILFDLRHLAGEHDADGAGLAGTVLPEHVLGLLRSRFATATGLISQACAHALGQGRTARPFFAHAGLDLGSPHDTAQGGCCAELRIAPEEGI